MCEVWTFSEIFPGILFSTLYSLNESCHIIITNFFVSSN